MNTHKQIKRAIIGGTGFLDLKSLNVINEHTVSTPFGDPSSAIYEVDLGSSESWYVLLRHGNPHHIAPHCVNYRANLWALHSMGVRDVVAVNAVGGIDSEADEGCLVLPDQLIDYTYARAQTYYDLNGLSSAARSMIQKTLASALEHIEFTQPFSEELRARIMNAAQSKDIEILTQGVCAVTQGPRLETAAEIQRLKNDGCDIVGMTSMPEASLARELSLNYASIALVVNKAAGLSDEDITLERIHEVADSCMQRISVILKQI